MSDRAGSGRSIRLFFDARYVRTDFHDGISRFSTELAAAVHAAAPERGVEVTFLIHDAAQRRLLPEGVRTLTFHRPTSWREPFSARLLNRFEPDIVFSPMQMIGSWGRRHKLILTLHDTIYYRRRTPPQDLPALVRLGWRLFHLSPVPQRATLNGADAVATVSETTRRQLAAMSLTRRPVVVIPDAPQRLAALLPGGAHAVSTDGPIRHLVYMGSFMPYKNVETIVRAMRLLPGRTLHLLSRIDPARRAELTVLAAGSSVIFHDGVTDDAYAALLADRALLVTTSLDEGYGLPIAEALAMGVPAVVSDLAIFHEVAGGGALYVDPLSPDAFAEAVVSLDADELRARVIAEGTAHIARFTWSRSAGILLDTVDRLTPG